MKATIATKDMKPCDVLLMNVKGFEAREREDTPEGTAKGGLHLEAPRASDTTRGDLWRTIYRSGGNRVMTLLKIPMADN